MFAAATAKSLQSCPTLCDPRDGSRPGSPVPGILQARTLEWVASSFSNAWKWKVKVKSLSRVRLLATSWTAAYQAPPSMGFSRQEYWSGVPLRLRMSIYIVHWFGWLVTKSCLTLVTPWTVSCQAPLSMRLPRQEHWSRLPSHSPVNPSNPGITPLSWHWQAGSLPLSHPGKPVIIGKSLKNLYCLLHLTLVS